MEGDYDVDAALPPTVSAAIVWPKNKNIVNGKDITIYERNAFFPANYIANISTGKMRQYKLVTVSVNPVLYNPVTKKLKIITGGQISVYDVPEANGKSLAPATNKITSFGTKIQSMTVNFSDAAASYGLNSVSKSAMPSAATPSAGETYAIITTNAIASQSTELQNFINSKKARGFNVVLVDETVWGGGTGDAAANRIRNWLQTNYQSSNISYVLFIGNPDPVTGDVPMKMAWPRLNQAEYQECPTDFYYAELTGSWDLNNDGIAGEFARDYSSSGGADKFAEVAVGRIPYYGVMSDLDRILAKTIAYENERSTTFGWRTNMLLPMEPSDMSTPGYHLGESINNNFVKPTGWNSFRIYDKNYGVNPELSPCSEAGVFQSWVKGAYGAVIWWTHGSNAVAADIMSNTSSPYLNQQHPSFTFQVSCTNAYPEDYKNLCYSILKTGGIATVGATRVSWYYPGQTNFVSSPSNTGLSYTFAEDLVQQGMYVADAVNDMKARISMNDGNMWMNWLVFNVYGDPAIGIYTSPDNFLLVRDIPDQKIFKGESFRSINLNDYVFNSKYTDDQVTWSVSGNVNLNVVIGSDKVATVTPKSSSWSGKEKLVFKATDPAGLPKIDTVTCEIAGTQLTYLSDLNWVSATTGYGDVQKDNNIEGYPLQINGTTYTKGIGTHAQSEIVYQLDGTYDLFSSTMGVDDMAGGSISFQVYGDTTLLYSSDVLHQRAPAKCEVYIRGYNQLRLVVNDGGNGINGDWADWADAKIVKGITTPTKTIQATVTPHVQVGCNLLEWDRNKIYNTDSLCSHVNHVWRAKWYTQNQEPGTMGQYGPWEDNGECAPQETSYFGKTNPSGTVLIDSGSTVTITMLPDAGYTMTALSVDGQELSTLPNDLYTFSNVAENHSIQVSFDKDIHGYLNVTQNGVSTEPYYVIGSGDYSLNRAIAVVAHPAPGYKFTDWQLVSGDATISDPYNPMTTITLKGNASFYANYQVDNGQDCNLTSTPAALSFGAVLINTSINGTVTLTNDGTTDAVVTSLNSSSAQFTISQALPLTIPATTSKTITVAFKPTAAGVVNGVLTIINAPDNIQVQKIELPLSGEGTSAPFDWELTITPSIFSSNATISFTADPAYVNTNATFKVYQNRSGAPRTLIETFTELISSGNNSFTRPVWDYLPAGYYDVELCNAAGDVIFADYAIEKLTKVIDFVLAATPAQAATDIVVSFNNPSPYLVGKTADLLFQNGSSTFTKSVTIVSGTNSTSQSISSRYYPLGAYMVIMSIDGQPVDTTNFTKVEKNYTLTASVSSIDVGNVVIGNNATASVTLTNTGNTAALISGMSTSDPVFIVTPAIPITVQPGASSTVTVKFTPTAIGTKTGTLTIINAPDIEVQTLVINLRGTGQNQTTSPFEVTMTPDASIVGNAIQPMFTVKNIGTTSIDMSKIVIEYYTYDASVNISNLVADIYYCSIGNSIVSGTFSKLDQTYGTGTQKADTKAAFTFTAGTIASNTSMQLNVAMRTSDWQYNFDEGDDWSHTVQTGNKAPFVVIRDNATNAVLFGTVPTGM